jgi:hypothetical protein
MLLDNVRKKIVLPWQSPSPWQALSSRLPAPDPGRQAAPFPNNTHALAGTTKNESFLLSTDG